MTDAELRTLYREAKTIAVVGCSRGWPKPACVVPAYMQAQGYRIVPVNPYEPEVLGEPSLPSLAELPGPTDIVNVFRPAEEAPGIAADAVELGARCLWLQTGIVSEQARTIAEEGGVAVVMNLCIGITHGELGLGPGVAAWKAEQEAARF